MVREVAGCNVIYVDKRVRHERVVGRQDFADVATNARQALAAAHQSNQEHPAVTTNTQALLTVFKSGEYSLCSSQGMT